MRTQRHFPASTVDDDDDDDERHAEYNKQRKWTVHNCLYNIHTYNEITVIKFSEFRGSPHSHPKRAEPRRPHFFLGGGWRGGRPTSTNACLCTAVFGSQYNIIRFNTLCYTVIWIRIFEFGLRHHRSRDIIILIILSVVTWHRNLNLCYGSHYCGAKCYGKILWRSQ